MTWEKGTDSAQCLYLHSSPLDAFGTAPKALELSGEGRLDGEKDFLMRRHCNVTIGPCRCTLS